MNTKVMLFGMALAGLVLSGCMSYDRYYVMTDPQCETKAATEPPEYVSGDDDTMPALEKQGFVVIGTMTVQSASIDENAVLELAKEKQAAKVVVITTTVDAGYTNGQNARLMNNQAFGGVGYTPDTADMSQMTPINAYKVFFVQERK